MQLFIGNEAEGPDKGALTLFIGSKDVGNNEILKILSENPEIKRVYFGANNNQGISDINVELLEHLTKESEVVIEINNPEQYAKIWDNLAYMQPDNIKVVLTLPVAFDFDFMGCFDIKLVNEKKEVVWFEMKSKYFTEPDDILYKTDKEVV